MERLGGTPLPDYDSPRSTVRFSLVVTFICWRQNGIRRGPTPPPFVPSRAKSANVPNGRGGCSSASMALLMSVLRRSQPKELFWLMGKTSTTRLHVDCRFPISLLRRSGTRQSIDSPFNGWRTFFLNPRRQRLQIASRIMQPAAAIALKAFSCRKPTLLPASPSKTPLPPDVGRGFRSNPRSHRSGAWRRFRISGRRGGRRRSGGRLLPG